MDTRVVARYRNGRLIKGTTNNFLPSRERFNLTTADRKMFSLRITDLKALFFVKSFLGDRAYNENQAFGNQFVPGRKLRCEFQDGEVLVGSSDGPAHPALGFFLVPADPKSNNLKVFVVASSVRRIALAG